MVYGTFEMNNETGKKEEKKNEVKIIIKKKIKRLRLVFHLK